MIWHHVWRNGSSVPRPKSGSSNGARKTKDRALDDACQVDALRQRQVGSAFAGGLAAMGSSLFFRPEEYGLASEFVGDAIIFQFVKIQQGYVDHGASISFLHPIFQIAVDLDVQGPLSIAALGFHDASQRFFA
jgi:hypothetical protein